MCNVTHMHGVTDMYEPILFLMRTTPIHYEVGRDSSLCKGYCYSVLQCVAVYCRVLQGVAVCCSVLQCVAVCCSVAPTHYDMGCDSSMSKGYCYSVMAAVCCSTL